MPNLLDTIRQNSQAAAQAPGMTDEGQRVAQLLRAKSGKAVAAPATSPSGLAEQQAVVQGQQQMQNVVQPQIQLQNAGQQAQQAAQQQAAQLQQADIGQQRQFNRIENNMKTQQLLNAFEQDRGKLDLDRNRAQVQQFAQGLRLQNQQYIDQLQREGARARLDDEAGFQEQLSKSVFGDSEALLRKQLGNRSILNSTQNEYSKALAQMGVDDAWRVFEQEKKAARERAPWEALGSLSTIGAAAYGASSEDSGDIDATRTAQAEKTASTSDESLMRSRQGV